MLESLKNARDLGGIPLASGAAVKSGRLIRSCALGQANAHEIEQLRQECNPRFVIDLRAADEAAKEPDPIRLLPDANYINIPLAADDAVGIVRKGDFKEALALMKRVANDPNGMMVSMYRDIVLSERGRNALSKVIDILLEADGECVLWHCTAGKDRAGITAAVILSLLGADRQTVYDDYIETNDNMEPYLEKQRRQLRFAPKKVKRGLNVMNEANPAFLDAAFDAIDEEYGSFEDYIEAGLGLTEDDVRRFREIYSERLG